MADGQNEYNIVQMRKPAPASRRVYASEGAPLISGPNGSSKARKTERGKPVSALCLQPRMRRTASFIEVGGLPLRCIRQNQREAGSTPLQGHQDHEGRRREVSSTPGEKRGRCDQGALTPKCQSLIQTVNHDIRTAKNSVAETLAQKIVR